MCNVIDCTYASNTNLVCTQHLTSTNDVIMYHLDESDKSIVLVSTSRIVSISHDNMHTKWEYSSDDNLRFEYLQTDSEYLYPCLYNPTKHKTILKKIDKNNLEVVWTHEYTLREESDLETPHPIPIYIDNNWIVVLRDFIHYDCISQIDGDLVESYSIMDFTDISTMSNYYFEDRIVLLNWKHNEMQIIQLPTFDVILKRKIPHGPNHILGITPNQQILLGCNSLLLDPGSTNEYSNCIWMVPYETGREISKIQINSSGEINFKSQLIPFSTNKLVDRYHFHPYLFGINQKNNIYVYNIETQKGITFDIDFYTSRRQFAFWNDMLICSNEVNENFSITFYDPNTGNLTDQITIKSHSQYHKDLLYNQTPFFHFEDAWYIVVDGSLLRIQRINMDYL
jgi:hypothetical protein